MNQPTCTSAGTPKVSTWNASIRFSSICPGGGPRRRSVSAASFFPTLSRDAAALCSRSSFDRSERLSQGHSASGAQGARMITNDLQYRSTKAHLRKFEEALANLIAAAGDKPSKLQRLEIDAVSAQSEDRRAEIREYEALLSGNVSTFEASSLAGLASLLIKARIARGWSQRRLDDALGIAEQQVQNGTRRRSTAQRAWRGSAMWPRPWVWTSWRQRACVTHRCLSTFSPGGAHRARSRCRRIACGAQGGPDWIHDDAPSAYSSVRAVASPASPLEHCTAVERASRIRRQACGPARRDDDEHPAYPQEEQRSGGAGSSVQP